MACSMLCGHEGRRRRHCQRDAETNQNPRALPGRLDAAELSPWGGKLSAGSQHTSEGSDSHKLVEDWTSAQRTDAIDSWAYVGATLSAPPSRSSSAAADRLAPSQGPHLSPTSERSIPSEPVMTKVVSRPTPGARTCAAQAARPLTARPTACRGHALHVADPCPADPVRCHQHPAAAGPPDLSEQVAVALPLPPPPQEQKHQRDEQREHAEDDPSNRSRVQRLRLRVKEKRLNG
jgi:hypothetical protein